MRERLTQALYRLEELERADDRPTPLRRLDSRAQRMRALYIDDIISEITVKGWSSPNGLPENNVRIAEARARNTAEYLAMRADIPRSLFKVEWCGMDWSEIEKAAAETTDMPYRD